MVTGGDGGDGGGCLGLGVSTATPALTLLGSEIEQVDTIAFVAARSRGTGRDSGRDSGRNSCCLASSRRRLPVLLL